MYSERRLGRALSMHTSGLVLTLADDPRLAESAIEKIAAAGPFELGECSGFRRAAVLETTSADSSHRWHDWLQVLPGIAGAEVVFVHWDED
jgi:hypothetical protein